MTCSINWLHYLSPLDNFTLWTEFRAADFAVEPPLRYPATDIDLAGLRRRLATLPIERIELPAVAALLVEKQHELELQIDLIRLRHTPGFRPLTIELFGAPDVRLVATARQILEQVPAQPDPDTAVGCEEIVGAAAAELDRYRQQRPDLDARVTVVDDLNSNLMVENGDLLVAANASIPRNQLAGLMAHEVGTHVLTFFNGRQQPLRGLGSGLAHYDALQEGLGVLGEFLTGPLPGDRLRVLAARVVASKAALEGSGICEIFRDLCDLDMAEHDAFDTAVRASRGGCLSKDIVYLRGLAELLDYVADGGRLERLFIGKFALNQLPVLEQLLEEGYLVEPTLVPRHLAEPGQRLKRLAARAHTPAELITLEDMS